MIEPIEYFDQQIKDKLKQIPRAINGNAPKERVEKILEEIYLLKKCIELFSLNGVVASVLCIDALTSWEITIGRKYEILNESHNQYLIKNDKGINDWIHKDWFKRL